MKDYKASSSDDLAKDEFFQSWVFYPNENNSRFWTDFISANPEKTPDIDEARRILKHLTFKDYSLSDDEITQLWQKVKDYPPADANLRRGQWLRHRWLKVAASLLILLTAFIAYQYNSTSYDVTYHTAFGESKNIVLPDSSTVVLNSNSSLRFQNDWDTKRSREIWIEGEAFFSVAHLKSNKPFIVRTTEGLGVRVLGTSFNVYHRTRETKVVLNTGRIELQLPEKANLKQNILMQPGDLVEYKDKSFSKKRVNPEVYSAWTEQKLVLDHTSLREMVKLLQDTYGITVIVKDDSLLNQTASGSMPIKDGEGLISQIAHIFQLKSEKQKNNYVMYQ